MESCHECCVQKKRSQQLSAVRCSQIASSQCSAPSLRKYGVVNFYHSQQRWLILRPPSDLISSLVFFPSILSLRFLSSLLSNFLSFREHQSLRQCMRGLAQNQYRIWRGTQNELIIQSSFSFLPFFLFSFLFLLLFYRLLLLSSFIVRARRVC
jgi:hypothetical protein